MCRLNFHTLESLGTDAYCKTLAGASDEQVGRLIADNVITGDFSQLLWVAVLTTAAERLLGSHSDYPRPLDGLAAVNASEPAKGWGEWDCL